MRARALQGKRVGTFDGKAGDQFAQAHGKVDVLIGDSYTDPETGEQFVEITFRADQPVDEQRIHVEIPDHGLDNFIAMIQAERSNN